MAALRMSKKEFDEIFEDEIEILPPRLEEKHDAEEAEAPRKKTLEELRNEEIKKMEERKAKEQKTVEVKPRVVKSSPMNCRKCNTYCPNFEGICSKTHRPHLTMFFEGEFE